MEQAGSEQHTGSAASPVVPPFPHTLAPIETVPRRSPEPSVRPTVPVRSGTAGADYPSYRSTNPLSRHDTILPYDPRYSGYVPHDLRGRYDINEDELPIIPFGTLGPNYRLYRLDNVSTIVTTGDAGRIAKYVKRSRGIRLKMANFDGSSPIDLLPFPKDIRLTINAQRPEGVAVRVVAHFLEKDAERLYTSYTMTGVRAGSVHSNITWPGLINTFIKRYLTNEVLAEAHEAVSNIRQLAHETEDTYADRLENNAYRCTAVLLTKRS